MRNYEVLYSFNCLLDSVRILQDENINYDIMSDRVYCTMIDMLKDEGQKYQNKKDDFDTEKETIYQAFLTEVKYGAKAYPDELMQRYLHMLRCSDFYDDDHPHALVHELELRLIKEYYKIVFVPKSRA